MRWISLFFCCLVAACSGEADAPVAASTNVPQAMHIAPTTAEQEAFFAWAEERFPQLFPGPQSTRAGPSGAAYRFRWYPATEVALAVMGTRVYAMGPMTGGRVVDLGALASFPPASPVWHTTISQSDLTSIDPARNVAIRDNAGWLALWSEMHRMMSRAPPLPAIDFAQDMVVGVFIGWRSSGCYAVEIGRIEVVSGVLRVNYHERIPEPGSTCAAIITTPGHVVRLPRFEGAVEFVRTQ